MKKNFILSLFVALLLGSNFDSKAQTQAAPAVFIPSPGSVNFVNLQVEPGATNIGTGDDVLKPITLPFPFSIYGQVPTTNFDLSTNGWLGDIANTSSDLSNSCPYPDPNGAFPRLAFFHDDLDFELNSPSAIWVKSFPADSPGHPGHPVAGGTCIDAYMIHFRNAQNFPGLVNPPATEMFNIEVILYANGSIALLYATDIVNANPSATVAIQGIGNPAVTLPGCNTAGMIQSSVYYLEAMGGTAPCGGGGHCVPDECVTVICPPNVTVSCFEDYEIDAANAVVQFNCGGDPCHEVGGTISNLTPVLKTVGGVCGPAAVATEICDCPAGFLAVGYEGIQGNSWGPQVLNQFKLRCKQLNQDGTLGSTVTVTCSNGTAINSNVAVGPVDAGTNQAMVGGQLRIGCAIDAVIGFSKPLSEIIQGLPNSTNTQMPMMGGTGGSLGPLQLAPNGNVIVGMQTYRDLSGGGTNNISGGVAWRYAPIVSCGGGGTGTEAFRYVDQPHITGAPNCPGTTYELVYHIGDDLGNVGCCVQTITIENAAPVISVTPGESVSCYEDIEALEDAATVTTSCDGPYDLKILPPVVNGVHECPGTTYTYAYRVRDNCGREVIANRVFTIGNNPAPTIVAPPDMTISCNYFAEINPAYAEVTTGCTLGYTTTVTGPITTGTDNCPGATYTYTYTVTDECGRTASDTRKFTVANTAPVFLTCPSVPLIINCEDDGWQQIVQAWLASVTAESSCGTALSVTNNYNPNTQGLCINNGTRTVRWMATDNCGRTSICEQMLIVADTEPPVFVTAPQNELVVCNYITQDKLDAWVDAHGNAVVDDCWANVTWTTTPNNPTINCGGNPGPTSLTVTFIATDGCGNKSSMDATFTALPAIGIGGSGEEDLTEESLQLFQNQPNPFNDQTTISFYLPEATKAILSIYDVSGKLLKVIEGDYSQGMNMEEISRSDLQGAGLLYYKLSTENETATRRMILLD